MAERHLADFIRQFWEVVEPGTPYMHSWHVDLIAEHLEAVEAGEITRLIINQPPRTGKSLDTTVMAPPWMWIKHPEWRFMFASYAAQLSTDHSVARRRILESEKYRQFWPHVRLTTDVNIKTLYENDRRGKMIATSVGGSATGMGGRVLIIDDALNPQEAYSDVKRVTANEFFDKTLSTRLDDKHKGVIIVVMQRLHENDLTGHLLARDTEHEWVHLCLREQESERTVVHFPRSGREIVREAGELLWPEREGPSELASVKVLLGTRDYNAQYQQDPAPAEGTMFKDFWWNFYLPAQLPPLNEVIQSWDLALEGKDTSDYVVGSVWGRAGASRYLLDQVRAQADFPETLRLFRLMAAKWPQANVKLVERAANGAALIATLKKEIPGIIGVVPKGSKEVRAQAATAVAEAGNVLLPALSLEPLRIEPWVQEWIDEMSRFPVGLHDDQVDSYSMAMKRLNKPSLVATTTAAG